MAAPPCHRATDIALRVAVPRDAAGAHHAGVRSKFDGRDDVDVLDVDVVDLRPRLNDLPVAGDVSVPASTTSRSRAMSPSGSRRTPTGCDTVSDRRTATDRGARSSRHPPASS
ncbi:hypothetical protein [Halorubrum sp. Boch-26]|uniref:hypothetical protein n=1 Tax=Halorubrum sp. Boch-26 TaxID=2994426 RepID=UPI0024683968|nr:hypothetical protein [Halorubrum sp. Boch-26]